MTAVVVGYLNSEQGRAALRHGIAEARLRGARLVVVNSSRGDALVDERYLGEDEIGELHRELDSLDLPSELRQQGVRRSRCVEQDRRQAPRLARLGEDAQALGDEQPLGPPVLLVAQPPRPLDQRVGESGDLARHQNRS